MLISYRNQSQLKHMMFFMKKHQQRLKEQLPIDSLLYLPQQLFHIHLQELSLLRQLNLIQLITACRIQEMKSI